MIRLNGAGPRALLAAAVVASSFGGNVKDLAPLLPVKIAAFAASGPDAVFDRKTLYDYMDGGAEVFLAFDFREVLVRRYKKTDGNEIILDIYDMGSAAEAYGMLSLDRSAEASNAEVGQESRFGFGLLRFRQGRYFVSIMTTAEDEEADRAVLELGKAAAAKLGPPGPLPELLEVLPENGLSKDRTSFFHAPVHLNNRYFVAAENILNLDRDTDCVFAEYASGSRDDGRLLVVRYPDEDRARAAEASFRKAFLPEAGAGSAGAVMIENRRWIAVRAHRRTVAVVFEAPEKSIAERLLAAVRLPSTR
jgi:hypothetical protein